MMRRDTKTGCRTALALVLLALASLAGGVARAADYEVEVIVFRHKLPQAAEAWAGAGALPDFGAARRLAAPSDASDAASVEPMHDVAAEPAPFTRLSPTAFRLAGVEKLLAGSADYEVVAHEAWRQPGEAGIAVYIGDQALNVEPVPAENALGDDAAMTGAPALPPRARAEGTLRLQVALPEMRVQTDFVVLAGDTPVRVKATRNLKSGELHYLDHELLGILLQISSLAPAAPEAMDVISPNADLPPEEFSD